MKKYGHAGYLEFMQHSRRKHSKCSDFDPFGNLIYRYTHLLQVKQLQPSHFRLGDALQNFCILLTKSLLQQSKDQNGHTLIYSQRTGKDNK